MKFVVIGWIAPAARMIVALHQVALEQHVAREASVVEHLPGVHAVRRLARREHLVERLVALRPEVRAPGGVEGVDVAVAVGQPAPERVARGIREVHVQVAAVLVVDVPHHDGRMRRIPLGDRRDELGGQAAVHRRRRRELLAAARPVDGTVLVLRQQLGVARRSPTAAARRWPWRGRRRCRPRAAGRCTRSSQSKSNSPSRGWMRDQAKMPRLTMVTPASRMRATSSGQISSGHCSGL